MPKLVKRQAKLGCSLGLLAVVGLLAGCLDQGSPAGVGGVINVDPRQGRAPLEVTFSATVPSHGETSDGDWLWEFGDGTGVVSGREVQHTFTRPGEYSVILRVVGSSGIHRTSTTVRVLNNAPVASFSFYPRDPFEGETVSFDGSESYDPDGRIVRWSWDFGDGNTAEGELEFAEHEYTLPGSYTVRLTVEDELGEQASTSRAVEVEDCAGGCCGRR